jgi:hypothetical protein
MVPIVLSVFPADGSGTGLNKRARVVSRLKNMLAITIFLLNITNNVKK